MDKAKADDMKDALLNAVKQGELVLYYQPQYNLRTSRFEGVEALIRWQHPQKGLLMPNAFVPLAESSGLILRIGEWVLRTACQQNKVWLDKGLPPLRMAVNISSRQFNQKDFVELVVNILHDVKLRPAQLELEIMENIILHEDVRVIDTIRRLKKIGVKVALDDFGTGYSSISHLKRIPIDRIKIDKAFVKHIHEKEDDEAIIKAIIGLAMGLNMHVCAEGVETPEQLEKLRLHGCVEAQGYYFSEPKPAAEIEKFLLRYASHPFI